MPAAQEYPIRLPENVHGWTPAEGDHSYSPDNLFDYIDGGAELYLSYGFTGARSRRYAREGEPDIIVDVFDMGSARDACGVFLHGREVIDETFGQGSQYVHGMLLFWKDRYYVSLLASPETPASKNAVYALAEAIEESIPRTGDPPPIIGDLPAAGLVLESIRFFHHHLWLNTHYYVSDANIFQIDDATDAVLARYGNGPEKQCVLLMIDYPNPEHAGRGERDFLSYYLDGASPGEVTRIEDGTWSGCARWGRRLAVVFGGRSEGDVTRLLAVIEGGDREGEGRR